MDTTKETNSSSSSSSPNLMEDIYSEILTRVSLDTLGPCRRVCKEWRIKTHDSYFTTLHCQRKGVISGYYLQGVKRNRIRSSFVSMNPLPSTVSDMNLDVLPIERPRILASSSHGLLCCVSERWKDVQFYVCKPATKEWIKIPNPKTKYFTEKVAMAVQSDPLHFIIVRFSKPNERSYKKGILQDNFHCEIFDSKLNKWRRRSQDRENPCPRLLLQGYPILMNGAFHWLTSESGIFAFDIATEDWKIIALPEEVAKTLQLPEDDFRGNTSTRQLVRYEGRLGLLYSESEWMDLWVMENYYTGKWFKRESLNLNPCFEDLYTDDVAFKTGYEGVIWYNYRHQRYTKGEIKDPESVQEIFPFQSDSECSFLDNRDARTNFPKD